VTTADNQRWLCASLVAIFVFQFLVLLWHGAAHIEIPAPLTAPEAIFVALVIYLMPVASVGLLRTSYRAFAVWLITLSMLGSLLFGFINHFMRASPDYVLTVPPNGWCHSFVVSAALLVVTETIGTVMGVAAIKRSQSLRTTEVVSRRSEHGDRTSAGSVHCTPT